MDNNTQWLSSFIKGKVLTETEKSALIGMPLNSKYEGYKFWHSKKCTHTGEKAIRVDYTSEYVFRLFKEAKMDDACMFAKGSLTKDTKDYIQLQQPKYSLKKNMMSFIMN